MPGNAFSGRVNKRRGKASGSAARTPDGTKFAAGPGEPPPKKGRGGGSKPGKTVRCTHCKQAGHYRVNCPRLDVIVDGAPVSRPLTAAASDDDLRVAIAKADTTTPEGRVLVEQAARALMSRSVGTDAYFEHLKLYDALTKGAHGARMEQHLFAVQSRVRALESVVARLEEERASLQGGAGPPPQDLPETVDDTCDSPSGSSTH